MKYIRHIAAALVLVAAAVQLLAGNPLNAFLVFFAGGAALTPWSEYMPGIFCNLAIPQHYMRVFSANWEHTVQQEMKKLAGRVTIDSYEGKEKVYTDINQVEFDTKVGRLNKTNLKEVSGAKRKSTRQFFTCHHIFDKDDATLLGMLGRPDSELLVELRYAFQRKLDERVIAAASGTVYGGADPYVTPITLPNTQKVDVDFVYTGAAANSGMTVDKIQRAIKIIQGNNLDHYQEQFFLAMSPRQQEDLFQIVKSAPSSAYANMIGDWLQDPSKKLFGFNVIISNLLTRNTSTDVRTCLVWSQRGIYAAPDTMEIKIDPRPDLEHATQISAYGNLGFMRRREERVIEIFCDESP
jgi:hypothetical protein